MRSIFFMIQKGLEGEIKTCADPVVYTLFGEERGAGETATDFGRFGIGGGGSVGVALQFARAADVELPGEVYALGFGVGVGKGEEVHVEFKAAVLGELPCDARDDAGTELSGGAWNRDIVCV